jgi:hypothetical protein
MGTRPDGKPDRRHIERKTLKAIRARVHELERQRDAGMAGKAGRTRTVWEMLTRHLDVVLPQRGWAPKTITSRRSLCEHQIFPRWRSQRIDRLLREYIENGYADMLTADLSAGTIVKIEDPRDPVERLRVNVESSEQFLFHLPFEGCQRLRIVAEVNQ